MEDKELLQAIGKMLEPLYKDMGELKDDVQSLKADNAKLVEMEKSLRLLVEGQQGMNEKFKQLDKLTADVENIKITVNALEAMTKTNTTDIKELKLVK